MTVNVVTRGDTGISCNPMEYPQETNEAHWQSRMVALRSFAAREGHTRIQVSHREDGVLLGPWAQYIRRRHRAGLLPAARVNELEAMPEWTWGPFRSGPPPRHLARDTEIRERYGSGGITLAEIGERYGLSRQRVHQIIENPLRKELEFTVDPS